MIDRSECRHLFWIWNLKIWWRHFFPITLHFVCTQQHEKNKNLHTIIMNYSYSLVRRNPGLSCSEDFWSRLAIFPFLPDNCRITQIADDTSQWGILSLCYSHWVLYAVVHTRLTYINTKKKHGCHYSCYNSYHVLGFVFVLKGSFIFKMQHATHKLHIENWLA